MSKWETYESATRRLFDDFNWPECTVYEYTETYTPGDGIEGSASVHADSPVDVHFNVDESSSRAVHGTDTDEDIDAWVKDDTGIDWTDYGEAGEHAMEIERPDGRRYRVETAVQDYDGTIAMRLTRVN